MPGHARVPGRQGAMQALCIGIKIVPLLGIRRVLLIPPDARLTNV